MSMGHVQQVGSPLDLYYNPANIFVASFIGLPPMNLFDVEVKNGELINDSFKVTLSNDEAALLKDYEEKTIVLGVRPEDVVQGGDINVNVFSNENLGQTTLINGFTGKRKITCKFRDWCNFKAGDSVDVSFNRKHFFDKETTEAISMR